MQLVVPSAVSMADSMLMSVCTANFQISFLFMVLDCFLGTFVHVV